MIGSRLAHYEIMGPIGAGGMGEVYRGRDTKLLRNVAIKVLPALFTADPERTARFEREAQMLAALNHPHIAAIYGLEEHEGQRFLVMELVEGETLAARMTRGPLPIEEILVLARQLAEALESAHELGIIHRDLKPANLMVDAQDRLKVLDFGLAKIYENEPADTTLKLSQSPTLTGIMTGANVILGTAGYMSPEQARGKRVDKRSDIWSFGCVLFEMLCGGQIFEGETVSDTLASVLKSEPTWDDLPPQTPEGLRRLLRRCLQKDPRRRLRDIGEARIALEADALAEAELTPGTDAAGSKQAPPRRAFQVVVIAAGLALSALAAGLVWTLKPTPPTPTTYAQLLPPAERRFALLGGGHLALSPDGRSLAFVAVDTSGQVQLWVRDLASAAARALTGTDGAAYPFWSPDSRQIGFFAEGKLKRIEAAGGAPFTVCSAAAGRGGTWNQAGVIVFTPDMRTPLYRVPATGGEAIRITALGKSQSHRWPWFLPDDEHYLYAAVGDSGATFLGDLADSVGRRLLPSDSNISYADGCLFSMHDSNLLAYPFDPGRGKLTGEAVTVTTDVAWAENYSRGAFAAGRGGTLVFAQGAGPTGGSRLTHYDRHGNLMDRRTHEKFMDDASLSPDGRRLAITVATVDESDVWVIDRERDLLTRLTFTKMADDPVWSPDGKRVAFASDGDLYVKAASGAGQDELLVPSDLDQATHDWSRDGRFLIYSIPGQLSDLWLYSFEEKAARPILTNPFSEFLGQLSPDGRWLAYTSNESSEPQVYLVDFPEMTGKWQVSAQGGEQPRWRADGRELFFLDPAGFIQVARLEPTSDDPGLSREERLFSIGTSILGVRVHRYAVSPDGQEFFVLESEEGKESRMPLELVLGWGKKK